MATSEADICNLALSRIGVKAFIDALDEDSTEAEACNVVYAQTRDNLLASYAWPFATKRAQLAQLASVTRTGWNYVFALPADCINPQYLVPPSTPSASSALSLAPGTIWRDETIPYALEQGDAGAEVLLTNIQTPELAYTARVEDAELFPPAFVDTLGWAIANELILSVKVKPELARMAEAKLAQALARAAAIAAAREQDTATPTPMFVRARR